MAPTPCPRCMSQSSNGQLCSKCLRRPETTIKGAKFGTVVDRSYASPRPGEPQTLTISTKVTSAKYVGYAQVKSDLVRRMTLDNLARYCGPAAMVIDAYNHSIWTNGWHIDTDGNDKLSQRITDRINRAHFDIELRKMTEDGLKFGYGLAEKIRTKSTDPRMGLVTRCARQFDLVINEQGALCAVRQYNDLGAKLVELPVEKTCLLMPMVTSEGFGKGILDQCYDALTWWTMVSQSSADSIYRHGYPVYETQFSARTARWRRSTS